MKLSEWLKTAGMTQAEFAERVGAHPMTVAKWGTGVMVPRAGAMRRISLATNGAVQPNDFYVRADAQATAP